MAAHAVLRSERGKYEAASSTIAGVGSFKRTPTKRAECSSQRNARGVALA
ncbi:hypothetical protein AKJ09_03528 [Labilithrix luteola]|uniref:Uncharacterized protein n=1 Tax=Labilithrix luteola TaxID=1391654 RepID=A0A0K1PUQ2_9BACT|nr:hypothetical protein AKJ09_03528 [Labilithrix luteola]